MADGFLGGVSDFAGGVGDFFMGGGKYADPKNINPSYGVPEADVRQAGLNTLGKIGGILLGAGQSMTGAERGQLLAQLGPALGGMGTDIYKSSQSRLMNAQQGQARQEMEELSAIDQRRKSDPTGLAREMNLPEQAIRALPARDLRELAKKIIIQQVTVDPATRAIQEASSRVPQLGAAAPATPAPTGGAPAQPAAPAGSAPQIDQSLLAGLSPEARRTVEVYQTALNSPAVQANPARVKELLENIDRLVPGLKQASEARGKALGAQMAAAPQALEQSGYMTTLLDQIATHPGREAGTGKSSFLSMLPAELSMGARDFSNRAEQISGQTFLQAYESLKGTGQITNVEGVKAEQAISRLRDRAVTETEYLQAIKDLRDVVETTRGKLSKKLGIEYTPAPAPDVFKTLSGGASSAEKPATRVRRFNPATGKIED
jgi:hypothetical protein